jgi:class 3 adenylate cyclase
MDIKEVPHDTCQRSTHLAWSALATIVEGMTVTHDPPLLASEGERKVVTVLFADVVGSSRHTRSYDDEEFRDFLDGCLAQMVGAVKASRERIIRP